MAITEFLLFILIATLGGMFLCGANDLITIFVAPECFSLCSYLLSGYTKRDVRSNEATMKYLLMGGASSSILVHGLSWLYGLSGGEIELQEIVNGLINTQMYNSPGISIALIMKRVGFHSKLLQVALIKFTLSRSISEYPFVRYSSASISTFRNLTRALSSCSMAPLRNSSEFRINSNEVYDYDPIIKIIQQLPQLPLLQAELPVEELLGMLQRYQYLGL
ncbi:hypothetical protein M5K25_003842 [Dendrobium thyrsiflorum]|uniref:NADH:quinone oxidoreductase/Mrp antiporter transmembrane domain-containing protein n=1 Tax=Dendrobium thyrsiflorum TaxID=117978 RepID=A0ABD0VL85_DENTH